MSAAPHRLYAWPLSLYSGKTRAYLRYKGIAHVEKPIHLWTFATLKKKAGAQVMPVVATPEGEWLQDTSHIIDVLEQRHPEAAVLPATPCQRIAALLIEAWGDEFWLPAAMHYRWNFPENYAGLFEPEGGDLLLPFAPRCIKNRVIAKPAALMRSYLPGLGVTAAQAPLIEAWTNQLCDALDAHFARLPYLFGTRPSVGDFGLIGPLYAHLGRDPYPARTLIAPRPHLQAWIARMQRPPMPRAGHFLPGDAVPATLAPVFDSIFGEFFPQLAATLTLVQKEVPNLPAGRALPRRLGTIVLPLAGQHFHRAATPYSLWMAQRVFDALAALPQAERHAVDDWLRTIGGSEAMQLQITPRLARRGLHVQPEAQP